MEKKTNTLKKALTGIILSVILIVIDQVTKLMAIGALGNFIDRVFRNYVVDFFYFKLIDFPVFNVADIYVTVAAFAMIILGLFYYKEEDYNKIFHD